MPTEIFADALNALLMDAQVHAEAPKTPEVSTTEYWTTKIQWEARREAYQNIAMLLHSTEMEGK